MSQRPTDTFEADAALQVDKLRRRIARNLIPVRHKFDGGLIELALLHVALELALGVEGGDAAKGITRFRAMATTVADAHGVESGLFADPSDTLQ